MSALDDLLWSRKLDFEKIYEIIPDLKENPKELKKLLMGIFQEDYKIKEHIKQCIDEFGEKFLVVLRESNLDINAFKGMYDNPLVTIRLNELPLYLEEKNSVLIEKSILEIVELLMENYSSNRERKTLDEEIRKNILNYLTTGDLELLETIKKEVPREIYGEAKRSRITFFESDSQVVTLLKLLLKYTEKNSVIERFINLFYQVDKYNYYCKTKFLQYKDSCFWKDSKGLIKALNEDIENEKREEIEKYVLLYTVEHYKCNEYVHNEVINYFVEKYSDNELLNLFTPRCTSDKELGYYLFSRVSKENKIKNILNEEENIKCEFFISNFKSYGKNDYIPFEVLYLSEDKYMKFLDFVALKDNKFLLKSFIDDSLDILEDPILKRAVDYFIKKDYSFNSFIEILIKSSLKIKEMNRSINEYFYRGTTYNKNIFAQGLNYIQDQNIKTIEIINKLPLKERLEGLTILEKNKNLTDEIEIIKNIGEDQNKGIRDIAKKILLNLGVKEEKLDYTTFNMEKFIIQNKIIKKLDVDENQIEFPLLKENNSLNKDFVNILLGEFKKEDLFETKDKIKFLSFFYTDESLNKLGDSSFLFWKKDMEAKSKWLLLVSIYYCNEKIIKEIMDLIPTLCEMSRMKLASFIIEGLSLRSEKWIIKEIEKIKLKSKFKSLKESASKALDNVSEISGISKYILSDYLVDDLGFKNKKICFIHGDKNLEIILNDDFTINFKRDDGKLVKTLPKIEDVEQDKISKNYIKLLKKQLKEEVTSLKEKVEKYYIENRKWTYKEWIESQDNELLKLAYENLIWGVYEGNNLKKVFLVQDNLDIKENEKIGLIHKSEVDNIYLWKESVKNSIIDQFNQEIVKFTVLNDLELIPEIDRKNPNTLITRLRKKGWNIGSIKDAGHFTELYKEIDSLDLGIEITLKEHPYIGGYGYESSANDGLVGIEKIEFYKPNTIKRGSYVYEELGENRYPISSVLKRVLEEILKEINTAFSV